MRWPRDDFEARFRLGTVRAGGWVSLLVCLAGGVYVALAADADARPTLALLVGGMTVASALIMWAVPWPRIIASRWRDSAFLVWTVSDFVVIALVAAVDGGAQSPLALAMFVPLVFVSLSYPRRLVAALSAFGIANYLLVWAVAGGDIGYVLLFSAVMAGTSMMGLWQADNHEGWRRQLARASRTDALTGILNRRGFAAASGEAFELHVAEGRPVTLLLIDLDHFKAFNDSHGHHAGDELLRWVAERLRESVREGDSVVRLGGDEFAVLLPNTSEATGAVIVERIDRALGDRAPHSLGRATAPGQGATFDDLYRAADTDLYRHKMLEPGRVGPSGEGAALERRRRQTLPAQVILEGITEAYYALDAEWRFVYVNEPAEQLLRRSAHELIGQSIWDEFPEALGTRFETVYRHVAEERRAESFEEYYAPLEGWFTVKASPLAGGVSVYFQEVTAQRESEERIRLQARLLAEVDAAVVATDTEGLIVSWNTAAEHIFGMSADEAIGQPARMLAGGRQNLPDGVRETLTERGRWEGELTGRRPDGSSFPLFGRIIVMPSEDGGPPTFLAVAMDITERVETARRLDTAEGHLRAVTDSMVEGLVTLDAEGRVTHMNATAERLLGWRLEDAAGRLFEELVGGASRAAADPFRRARAEHRVVRVEEDDFVRADGTSLPVAYTVGPVGGEAGGGGSVVVFSDASESRARLESMRRELAEVGWLRRVREALDEDRFVLYAQPIVEVPSGEILRHELLIRMRGPGDSLVMPGEFLPIAERYGVITEIDRWVAHSAARMTAEGHAVQINLSAQSVASPGFAQVIEAELAATGAVPSLLAVEITETALLEDEEAALAFVRGVKALGCEVAIDDFGSGYAGFRYVKQLSADVLKIDMEFVRDVTVSEASREVVKAIVALAGGLGLRTVAEGVESAEAMELLVALGVNAVQGYHLGGPAPLEEAFADAPEPARRAL